MQDVNPNFMLKGNVLPVPCSFKFVAYDVHI